jgi:hypothetical protein
MKAPAEAAGASSAATRIPKIVMHAYLLADYVRCIEAGRGDGVDDIEDIWWQLRLIQINLFQSKMNTLCTNQAASSASRSTGTPHL